MTRIYLIRHAETEPTGDDATLWPLSERGEQQAKLLAAQPFWEDVKAIITSDEQKAIATVKDVAFERGIRLRMHNGLRELRRTPGWLEEYDARVLEVFQKPALNIGGWERAADAQARMLTTLDELIRQFDSAPFAVVSHGMVLALLIASAQNQMGNVFDIWQQFGFADAVVIEIE